jgi:ribosomal protein L36
MIEVPEFEDRETTCADCGLEFSFTEGEQRYFWSKGLAEPKRCKPCRVIRRKSLISIGNIQEEHNEHSVTKPTQPSTSAAL